MNGLPRPDASDLGTAADVKGGQERRLFDASAAQSQALARLRKQRQVERISRVPRLVFELLDEIGRRHGIEADISVRLARYAELDQGLLATVGGDRFPASPTRLINLTCDEGLGR